MKKEKSIPRSYSEVPNNEDFSEVMVSSHHLRKDFLVSQNQWENSNKVTKLNNIKISDSNISNVQNKVIS